MNSREYLRIGQIVRAHGVHGAVKLIPTTDVIERFRGLSEAYLEERANTALLHCPASVCSMMPSCCKSQGWKRARRPSGCAGSIFAWIAAHAVQLPPDTYFIADLIGCETFDTEGARSAA